MKLIPLTLIAGLMICGPLVQAKDDDDKTAPSGPAVVRVAVAMLKTRTVRQTVSGYGTALPDSDALVSVSYGKSGQVAKILVRPGQSIAKGAGIVQFTTDPNAQAGFKKANSAVIFAKGEVERTRALLAQHLVTNSQMAAAEQSLRDAEAGLEAERALGTGAGTETLAAPFDGYVESLSVTLGDRIQPGAPIVKLGRGAGVKILAGIEPQSLPDLAIGQDAGSTALLGKVGQLPGKVVGIAGMLNPVTRMVDVTISLEKGADILPGTPVRAAIVTEEHQGQVVPRSAVLEDDDGAYLFQIKNSKAVRVAVEKGIESDDEIEVSGKGLQPALPVVVLGNYELADGVQVQINEAAK
jgi:RND family efflux transporter MFP subunit